MICAPAPRSRSARFVHALVLAGVALLMPGWSVADDDSVGSLGETERLVVRGTTQIDAERLRQPLLHDTDIVWLSRPHAPRAAFVEMVAHKAALALERAGFAEARVDATVEASDGVERLVLDVVEGPRFAAGTIRVSGLPDDVSARLVRWLSEPPPPPDAVPRIVTRPDGTTTTIWVAADGRVVTPGRPAWSREGPAACDAVAGHRIQGEVARFLRDEGYVFVASAAPRRRPRKTSARTAAPDRAADGNGASAKHDVFDVALVPAGGSIDLAVSIHELPPPAVLDRIELPPGCRTTERELAAHLGIEIGKPVSDRDRRGWHDRLRRSGRFLTSDVEFRPDPSDPAAAVARFTLEEYPAAPRLSAPLSPAEETMLRFHDWLEEAIGCGDDLVLDVERATPTDGGTTVPTPDPATADPASARLIVAPHRGLCLTVLPDGAGACGLAVTGSTVGILPAGGEGRLEVPLPAELGLTTAVSLSLSRAPADGAAAARYLRSITFGCGLRSQTGSMDGARPGMAITLAIEPVACLALVHEDSPRLSREADTLVIETGAVTSRFDVASGRPLGVHCGGYGLSLRRSRAAFGPAVDTLQAASGPNLLRDDVPVASAVAFLLSDEVAAATGRIADALGLPGDVRATWEQRLAGVVAALRACRDGGGLARCDTALAAAPADGGIREPLEQLDIPYEDECATAVAARKALIRHLAAVAWRLSEERCGRDSWPAALVRAGACAVTGDPAVLDEMAQFMASDDHGPLAHVSAATLATVPLLAASLARRGQERLSTVAFHTDCHPLLAAAAPYGLDTCCVALVRVLDDATAREIGRLACGDPEILLPLVHALQAHERQEDAERGLQDALDAWWDGSLREVVAKRLAEIASPRTATLPEPRTE